MLVDCGPVVTDELITSWQESSFVLLPEAYIAFLKKYGNGGEPDETFYIPVNSAYVEPEDGVSITAVFGIFHPAKVCNLENFLDVIPCHLPLFPFALDETGGMFGISVCSESLGAVYHYGTDERTIRAAKDLLFVANSPIEVFEKYYFNRG